VQREAVQEILDAQTGTITPEWVLHLCEQVRHAMRTDVARAATLAEAACKAARRLADPACLAEALRMRGHTSYLRGNNRRAVKAYEKAITILDGLGQSADAARTLSSGLQSLIYLGRYEEALAWAARARRIFEQDGDLLRLARLDSNEGNILHRQDRYADALSMYERAVQGLREAGDPGSAAIALRNMAVCHTALFDFDRAMACYNEASALYRENNLPLLAAEIKDNIAHLYFLRGDYIQAMLAYREGGAQDRGNTFHLAVARLDESELLLELNLFTQASKLAAEAAARLQRLGIKYERAKAVLNQARASFHLGDARNAMRLLEVARRLFGKEDSAVWQAVVELYRSAFLLEEGKLSEARESALKVLHDLDPSLLFAKYLSVLLLLVRVELRSGRVHEAAIYLRQAHQRAHLTDTLPFRFQLAMVEGELRQAQGKPDLAWEAYELAREILNAMRGQFANDGLRISFAASKSDCSLQLAGLALQNEVAVPLSTVLELVEEAKSRSLAEAMIGRNRPEPDSAGIEELRQELSWSYRELDRLETSVTASKESALDAIRSRIRQLEERLTTAWVTGQASANASTPNVAFSTAGLQDSLGRDESLIEYFTLHGQLHAFAVSNKTLKACRVATMPEVESACRMLRLQLSRGVAMSGSDATRSQWLAATKDHLRRLYQLLIAPLEPWLEPGHWTIVPQGSLHRVPFHALCNANGYVIDERTISYAPSAAVHWLCQKRPTFVGSQPVIFGVYDDMAPLIEHEVWARRRQFANGSKLPHKVDWFTWLPMGFIVKIIRCSLRCAWQTGGFAFTISTTWNSAQSW
jgi:tetratricopeptide (TPR) repeat protein